MLHAVTTGAYYPPVVTTWNILTTGAFYLKTGTLCSVLLIVLLHILMAFLRFITLVAAYFACILHQWTTSGKLLYKKNNLNFSMR